MSFHVSCRSQHKRNHAAVRKPCVIHQSPMQEERSAHTPFRRFDAAATHGKARTRIHQTPLHTSNPGVPALSDTFGF